MTFLIEAVGGYKDFEPETAGGIGDESEGVTTGEGGVEAGTLGSSGGHREGLERPWQEENVSEEEEVEELNISKTDSLVKSTAEEGFNEGEIFAFEDGAAAAAINEHSQKSGVFYTKCSNFLQKYFTTDLILLLIFQYV